MPCQEVPVTPGNFSHVWQADTRLKNSAFPTGFMKIGFMKIGEERKGEEGDSRSRGCASYGAPMSWRPPWQVCKPLLLFHSEEWAVKHKLKETELQRAIADGAGSSLFRTFSTFLLTPNHTCRLPFSLVRCCINTELNDIWWNEYVKVACFYFQLRPRTSTSG